MPYDPLQFKTDVDAITSSDRWKDEAKRRDFIREIGTQASGSLDPESHTQLMGELWGRNQPGMLSKAGNFVGTAVEEVVKSVPAAGGAAVMAASDLVGNTDSGSGTRLMEGVEQTIDSAGQLIKQLDPNDRQEQRDELLEALRQDLDAGAVPQGFTKWLAGEYDNKEIDDPDTKAFVDAVVSNISRAGVAADRMGDIDQEKLMQFMQSDRNPGRADSDVPDQAGARRFLADYAATRDPASWDAFKKRVTETDQQYESRLADWRSKRNEAADVLKNAPDGLAKEMIERSMSMQESPVDLASAALPLLRGAKVAQAAKAGAGAASVAKDVAVGALKEGAQEGATEALQDPRATLGEIGEAAALGAVGSGVVEGTMAGGGALLKPSELQVPTIEGETVAPEVKLEQAVQESATAPAPIAPLQKATTEVAEQSVAQNADLLPATAAALGITPDETIPAEQAIPAGEEVAATTEVETPIEERPLGDQAERADSFNVAQEQGSIPPDAQSFPQTPQEASVNETPVETQGVPLMVTRDMRQQLYDRGYSKEQVDKMTPQGANSILQPAAPFVEESPNAGFQQEGVTVDPTVKESLTVEEESRNESPETSVPTPEEQAAEREVKEQLPTGVSIANVPMNLAREALGLPAIDTPARPKKADEQLYEDARQAMSTDPNRGQALVASILERPRVVDDLESTILTRETVARRNALNAAIKAFNESTPENRDAAFAEVTQAEKALTEVNQASALAGSEQGAAFRARRFIMDLDYSPAGMVTSKVAAVQRPLTEKETEQAVKAGANISKLQSEVDELEASDLAEADIQSIFEKDLKEAEEESKAEAKTFVAKSRAAKKSGKTLTEFLTEQAAEARKRIRSRGANLNIGLNPLDLFDRSIVMASHIANGITSLADLTVRMVKEFGEAIRQHIPQIEREAKAILDTEKRVFEGDEQVAKSAIQELQDSNGAILSPRWVTNAVREQIKKGNKTLKGIFDVITAEVQKTLPDVTERQLRDMYSGYGKVRFPSQDEIDVLQRKLHTLAQLQSKIEDAVTKKRPLKSGPQRDKADQEVREMQRTLNRLMKEAGFDRGDDPKALETALGAVKTRLRNEIEDLDKQINSRERSKPERKGVEYDDETKALIQQRDEKRKTLDEISPKPPPSAQDQIRTRLNSIDREIAELQRRKTELDFAPKQNVTPITEQIQVKMDERDALKAELDELQLQIEGEPTLTQDQINELYDQQIERNIAETERQIKEQDFSRPEGKKAEMTPERRRMKAKLDLLREERDRLKPQKAKKVRSEDEIADAAIASLERSLEKMNQQIATGDIDIKGRGKAPDRAKIRNLQAERDSTRQEIQRLRKAKQDAAKDPEEEKLRKDRAHLDRLIKHYKDKKARGDFRPRPKKVREYSKKKLLEKEQELERAKYEWNKGLFLDKMARRETGAKIRDSLKQTIYLITSFFTAADVGGITRQGGRATFRYPKQAAKNLLATLHSLGSSERAALEKKKLKDRENYPLYKRHGLFIAEDSNGGLSEQDEEFMGRLIEKTVLNADENPSDWKKFAVLAKNVATYIPRASQRAHVTYLNNMRADLFDWALGELEQVKDPTPQDLDKIANDANIATGRGNLGKGNLARAAPFLSLAIWTPRMLTANVQTLVGQPLWGTSPELRKILVKDWARLLRNYTIIAGLGYLLYDDDDDEPYIEMDPRSGNFLQPKIAGKRYNYLSGLTQVINFLSRMGLGETKNQKGDITPLHGGWKPMNMFREVPLNDKPKYGGRDIGDTAWSFVRGRFTPAAGAFWDLLSKKDIFGKEITPTQVLERQLTPMMLNDVVKNMEESNVPRAVIDSIVNAVGTGVQHEFNREDDRGIREKIGDLIYP